MTRKTLVAIGYALLATGIAARLSNGWNFPVLGSYDAFSHFAYIWYLTGTWQVPVADQGWSYFHPPLYYAWMSLFWGLMDGTDPVLRLRVGKALVALFGCLNVGLAWRVAARRFPGDEGVAILSAGLLAFVPVNLYSAGFLGNEGLNAVLASLALYQLLAVMRRPTPGRGALLGLLLGLAMMTKFTSVVVVVAAVVSLASRGIVRGEARGAARALAAALAVLVLVCGGYYARNIALFGKPFQLARDITFMTAYVEKNQPQAVRGLADYLTFDPVIFYRPAWPRGATPSKDGSQPGLARAMRESVWTGLYANTWFDGFGGWVLPPVTSSESARRAGQVLLCLGVVPTLLVLFGLWSGVAGLVRDGWDDEAVAFGSATAAMLGLFVYGTHEAPIAAAVKATYFLPVSLAFAYWFALGLVEWKRRHPGWFTATAAACSAAALTSLAVFWQGLVFDPSQIRSSIPGYDDSLRNQLGVVLHAGGRTAEAGRLFEELAARGQPLATENLAYERIDAGRLGEGLRLLRRGAKLQHDRLEGGEIDRERFLRITRAEYDHSIAVVLYGLGRTARAESRWRRSLAGLPDNAEAAWCLAASRFSSSWTAAAGDADRRVALDDAREALRVVRESDPGLPAAWILAGEIEALAGDCSKAREWIARGAHPSWWRPRRFPAEAGNGAGLAAAIGRRRLIEPREILPELRAATTRCGIEPPALPSVSSPV